MPERRLSVRLGHQSLPSREPTKDGSNRDTIGGAVSSGITVALVRE